MKLLALILWLVLLAALAVPTFMILIWLEAEDRERPIDDEPPTDHHREM